MKGMKLTFAQNGKEVYTKTCEPNAISTIAVVPKTYNGLPVTAVGAKTFEKCTRAQLIIYLPSSIRCIESETGAGCHFGGLKDKKVQFICEKGAPVIKQIQEIIALKASMKDKANIWSKSDFTLQIAENYFDLLKTI